MTARIGSAATAKVIQRIVGIGGMNSCLAALSESGQAIVGPLDEAQVRAQNVAADLVERSSRVQYPVVHVYCEKLVNDQAEKFRSYSGKAHMAIEVRHSQDRVDGLQDTLEVYTDAAIQVLTTNRGNWGDGMFFGGEYEVAFGAVKHGGRNFIQVAKVTFEIGVSRS